MVKVIYGEYMNKSVLFVSMPSCKSSGMSSWFSSGNV